MRLEGKVALISGGARGQGATEGQLFVDEGAKVVLADILDVEGEATAAQIRENGGEASYVHLDVTSEDEWRNAVDFALQTYGRLDILINNAAIYKRTPIVDTDVEEWREIMEVNSTGVFLGTKHAIPAMQRSGGGSIINISSTAGLIGSARGSAYGASKGSVRLFTKYTAIQHATEGIRANSIHPGPIDTVMIADNLATPEARAESEARVPLRRIGTVMDVAYGALFLASDESSYMTGAELVIDGGVTAR
jgi:NAD(P)-dependent dehydrogenase (short-subunit alcohol dehydrogenase family)